MTVSLSDVPKGHEFREAKFQLTSGWLAEYRAAVEDGMTSPADVPSLSLATLSIRALLDQATLPDGAIHVSQEMSSLHPVKPDQWVVARARVASRGERAGWVLMGIELEVEDETGTSVMNGRATITFPAVAKGAV